MNDHTLFLVIAYGLTFAFMVWEVVALRQRRQAALKTMRQSQELDE